MYRIARRAPSTNDVYSVPTWWIDKSSPLLLNATSWFERVASSRNEWTRTPSTFAPREPATSSDDSSWDEPPAAAILAAVAAIRDQGFAATDGEFEPGIVGYALPVSRPGGAPVVVGASRPRDAATDHGRDDMLRCLRLCAADLRQSGALGSISAA